MKERRTKTQILVDILRLVHRKGGKAKSTHILYGANLSHKRLKMYLDALIENGFLEMMTERGHIYYRITKKGLQFIVEYRKIQEITDAFGVPI
ncbi:MAG: winged helix-turn-helix domain-containing protein [Candidatus Aenigmarchaeota archaeon]|nr:winged helix-turn-helix domain-containing protein [Candidatus Aenigmarchaeota archaeon]